MAQLRRRMWTRTLVLPFCPSALTLLPATQIHTAYSDDVVRANDLRDYVYEVGGVKHLFICF